jgi:hypothetical protein
MLMGARPWVRSALRKNALAAATSHFALGRPVLPSGIPLLFQIDPSLDLDKLRHFFSFEIVSEEDEGFVIF